MEYNMKYNESNIRTWENYWLSIDLKLNLSDLCIWTIHQLIKNNQEESIQIIIQIKIRFCFFWENRNVTTLLSEKAIINEDYCSN